MRYSFEQFLPADSMSLLQSALETRRIHSAQLIFSAAGLSIFAGLGVMLSLMDGFRRAYRQPRGNWGFWQRRLRALLLVPIVLVPLALATLVLVFGRQIEIWMIDNAGHELRHFVLILWRMVRWTIAPPYSGSRRRWLLAGTSRGLRIIRCFMDHLVPASPRWYGFISLPSVLCWARN